MKQTFDEWCGDRVCSECRYDHLGSRSACESAYEEDARELGVGDLLRVERKLDAIIKHFNVPIN